MKWSRPDLYAGLVLLAGALLIGTQRARLARASDTLRTQVDLYLLPPPEQAVVLSLGYRSALADLIFGHVLVSVGVHLQERRLFEFPAQYLEAVNTLDPKFRDPYRMADAIITLQVVAVPPEFYVKARAIMEKGTRELPFDQELWLTTGQFVAYLAPPHLGDKVKADAWRQDGARMLSRACELTGSNEAVPYHCLTAASLFSEAGNREASRAFLQKLLLVTDDPAVRELAENYLWKIAGEDARRLSAERYRRLDQKRLQDLPFVSRTGYLAIGPAFDAAACAGRGGKAAAPACATSSRAEAEQLEADVGASP